MGHHRRPGKPRAPVLVWRLVAAVVVSLAMPGSPAPAYAAGDLELQFLDTRPVVIDLDSLDINEEARWRVAVFNGQPGGPHRLRMHVLFDPTDVIIVEEEPIDPVPTGTVASFVIALDEELSGSGELVVTSDNGAVSPPDQRAQLRRGRRAGGSPPLLGHQEPSLRR